MSILIKLLFSGFCLFASVGYGRASVAYFQRQLASADIHGTLLAFGFGGFLYLLLWVFFFSRQERFWSVLEHEMIHAVFALFFFKRVHSFSATRKKGGMVEIEGDNFLIALAPYFFPLLTVGLMLLKPPLPGRYQWLLNGLLGFTMLFHLVHLTREFHPSQPDLQRSGMFFSVVVVLFFNIFFAGLCIAALDGEWGPMRGYLQMGITETLDLLRDVGEPLYRQLADRLAAGAG